MNPETFRFPQSENSKLIEQRKKAGWINVGRESLTETKFQKDARFLEEQYQTEEDIKESYLKAAHAEDPDSEYEVELVLDEHTPKLDRVRKIMNEEEFQTILQQLQPNDRTYMVFVRKKSE